MAAHHSASAPRSLLRRLLAAERSDLWAVVIYSVVIGLIYLAVPVATQAVVNTVAFGTVLQPLVVLTAAVFAALVFSGGLQLLRTYVVELLQQRLFVRMSGTVAAKLLNADTAALAAHRGPELVNRFLEVATLQKTTSVLLIDGMATASQIVFSAILLGLYHPWLLGFDVLLVLMIASCIFPFLRRGIATSVAESQTKYEVVAWFEELARYPELFRSRASTRYALSRTRNLLDVYLVRRRRHFRVLLKHIAGFVTIHALSSAALLGIGGFLVIQRQLTLGQLIASELVVNLMLNALTKFGKQLETYYDLEAAMDKLSHLTSLPAERDGHTTTGSLAAGMTVRLRKVALFDRERNGEFQEITADIASGQSVWLQAPGGSGASLLMDCIRGQQLPGGGTVELDGFDVRHLSREQLRSEIALVRTADIFEGTVAENLAFGADVTASEMKQVLAATGLWEAISRLPEGLESVLQSGGAPLTEGQAMRLAMARALLSKPRLLMVDIPARSAEMREWLRRLLFDDRGAYTLLIAGDDDELRRDCDRTIRLTTSASREEVTA